MNHELSHLSGRGRRSLVRPVDSDRQRQRAFKLKWNEYDTEKFIIIIIFECVCVIIYRIYIERELLINFHLLNIYIFTFIIILSLK